MGVPNQARVHPDNKIVDPYQRSWLMRWRRCSHWQPARDPRRRPPGEHERNHGPGYHDSTVPWHARIALRQPGPSLARACPSLESSWDLGPPATLHWHPISWAKTLNRTASAVTCPRLGLDPIGPFSYFRPRRLPTDVPRPGSSGASWPRPRAGRLGLDAAPLLLAALQVPRLRRATSPPVSAATKAVA